MQLKGTHETSHSRAEQTLFNLSSSHALYSFIVLGASCLETRTSYLSVNLHSAYSMEDMGLNFFAVVSTNAMDRRVLSSPIAAASKLPYRTLSRPAGGIIQPVGTCCPAFVVTGIVVAAGMDAEVDVESHEDVIVVVDSALVVFVGDIAVVVLLLNSLFSFPPLMSPYSSTSTSFFTSSSFSSFLSSSCCCFCICVCCCSFVRISPSFGSVETTGANDILFSGAMDMKGATKDEDKGEEMEGKEEEGAAESKGAVVARVID